MARRSDNNLIQKLNTFAQLLLGVKIFRFGFFFYSFLSFVFWFLNCFEVDWLYLFNWLFVLPYQLVSHFYTPQGVSADFSLAIIGGLSLLLGFIFDFAVNSLYTKIVLLEEEEERRVKQRRMKEKQINRKKSVQQEQMGNVAFEDSKLLFLILPHTNKIKRKKEELELTFQEVEIWKQRVNKKLIENISYSKPMQKGYYRKNLFLLYKDFNYADDFVYYIKPTLDSISLEFRKYGIQVGFSYVLSALTDIQNLEKELDCMDTILSLNFINEIIVTNRFKITYDNKGIQQYHLQIKGEYNLSKNLSVSNRQPLYSLVDKKKRGE
ncbi:hypothetical protein IJD15_00135 [bacterium]|nr:hypothetical protein [bacterium]